MGLPDFDLTPYIKDGGDWAAVRLWKIVYGDPLRRPMVKGDGDPTYVLAISAEHAIAISDWWLTEMAQGSAQEGEWPKPVLSVEGVGCVVLVDPRFDNSSGDVSCPKDV